MHHGSSAFRAQLAIKSLKAPAGINLVSLIYWLMWLAFNGKSFGEAVGEVEDAVGTFQGIILLGCLVSLFVGIMFGLKK
jgi:hypothetical protein